VCDNFGMPVAEEKSSSLLLVVYVVLLVFLTPTG
jgi:hypothetical protein